MANQWIYEPEFNRWYIKWTALDVVRAGIAVLLVKGGGYLYDIVAKGYGPIGTGLIGFLTACLTILVVAVVFTLRRKDSTVAVESPLELFNGALRWREGRLKQVANREFRNQEVPLDGIEYIDCVFDGVTFVYDGRGKTGISSSVIKAKPDGKPNAQFRSNNPLVGTIALIFHSMGFMREDAKRRIESLPLDRQ